VKLRPVIVTSVPPLREPKARLTWVTTGLASTPVPMAVTNAVAVSPSIVSVALVATLPKATEPGETDSVVVVGTTVVKA